MGNCPHIMPRSDLLPATCMKRSCHQQYPTKHRKLQFDYSSLNLYCLLFCCFFFNLIWYRSKNSKNGKKLSKIQRILITSSYFPTQHPTFMMIRTVAGLFSFILEISILLQRSLRCSGEPQVPFLEMPIVCITFHVYFSY